MICVGFSKTNLHVDMFVIPTMQRPYMKHLTLIALFFTLTAAQNCEDDTGSTWDKTKMQRDLSGLQRAYFASGCFWCVEAVFESVEGVAEAVSGYTAGQTSHPTYETVSAGVTGHAEAVEVYYDSTKVDYSTLLTVFFGSHDPTTLNRQGPDAGTQYRSGIYYQNDQEKMLIDQYIAKLKSDNVFRGLITTEVSALQEFHIAESYHQDYERKNPNNGYIRAVSIPRLKSFQAAYPELLKSGAH
jgi:peptide-methionine (S)-S-oxide reductase